jgi:tripartite-type tricarboxylate transporter receptor subunit TctC
MVLLAAGALLCSGTAAASHDDGAASVLRVAATELAVPPADDATNLHAPVTLIVPSPEGGSGDRIARVVAQQLEPLLESPVTLTFAPGQNGVAGINAMARAPKDGKTLGLTLSTPVIAGRLLSRQADYNPIDDFDWLAILGSYSNAIVVRADHPAQTLTDWLVYARNAPRPLRYGTAGVASAGHLAGEFLRTQQGGNLVHVPFASTVQAYGPLASGDIDALFDGVPSAIVNARPGAYRILAVTAQKRDPALPNVVAFGELWAGQHFDIWAGVVAPQGLPAATRVRLASAMAVIVLDKELPQKLRAIGFNFIGRGGADARQYVRDEIVRQAALIGRLSIGGADKP